MPRVANTRELAAIIAPATSYRLAGPNTHTQIPMRNTDGSGQCMTGLLQTKGVVALIQVMLRQATAWLSEAYVHTNPGMATTAPHTLTPVPE